MTKNNLIDISNILDEYSIEIQEGITKAAEDVANAGAKELKATSPKRTGKYSKGWRVNKRSGKGFVHTTIYNATNWQLTHLLENGHTTRKGGRTRSFVHIRPVEEKYVNEYTKDVENIIKNGG